MKNWDEEHPTYREELGRRLLSIVEKFSSKRAAADVAGISPEQLNKWMRADGPKVPVEALLALCAATGDDFYWLATGRTPPATGSDLIEISRLDVLASAGNGSFASQAKVLNTIPFRPEFFSQNLQRNPNDMVIVDASGDSMEPTMRDRDLVMIDTSTAFEVPTGAIYAFTYDGAVFVKRLQRQPGGIEAISENKEYPPIRILKTDMDKFQLIGRVVWIGRIL